MATKIDTKKTDPEELQAKLAQAEADKSDMEKRLAEAENAKADAEARATAAQDAADQARAEAEAIRDAEDAMKASSALSREEGEAPSPIASVRAGSADQASSFYDVYCKIPAGMTFPLPGGRTVRLAGVPLARLMDSQGRRLPDSGYGKTRVSATDWHYIRKTWNDHPAFRSDNPVIFARPVGKDGDDQAKEQAGVKTGFEQVEVEGRDKARGLKTQPWKQENPS